jgi:hypothetical protein
MSFKPNNHFDLLYMCMSHFWGMGAHVGTVRTLQFQLFYQKSVTAHWVVHDCICRHEIMIFTGVIIVVLNTNLKLVSFFLH